MLQKIKIFLKKLVKKKKKVPLELLVESLEARIKELDILLEISRANYDRNIIDIELSKKRLLKDLNSEKQMRSEELESYSTRNRILSEENSKLWSEIKILRSNIDTYKQTLGMA